MVPVCAGLESEAWLPYAIVTARNIVTSLARADERARRHAPRQVDLRQPEGPEQAAVRREEEEAVSVALRALSPRDRSTLVKHEIGGEDTYVLAESLSSTPAGVAAQLARARARMRVEYLLALRRVQLPGERCRPVLLALSAGDRRRQAALGAGRHLGACETCAALSEPLVARHSALAGVGPWFAALGLISALRRASRSGRVQAGTAAVVSAGVLTALVVHAVGTDPRPRAVPAPAPASSASAPVARDQTLTVDGMSVFPVGNVGVLRGYLGRVAVADHAVVQSVVANEGFWVGTAPVDRVWVQLTGTPESPARVQPGQRISFQGLMVPTPPDFANRVGVDGGEGAAQLEGQGVHIEVPASAIRIS